MWSLGFNNCLLPGFTQDNMTGAIMLSKKHSSRAPDFTLQRRVNVFLLFSPDFADAQTNDILFGCNDVD